MIDPVTVGFPKRLPGPGRRAPGLCQEQMDELLMRTPGTYNRFENGQLPNPHRNFLAAIAKILGLSEPEWTFLWQLTRKEAPPRPLHSTAGTSVAGVWQRVVEQIGGALAYVSDAEFDVIAHNEEFRSFFPRGQGPANMMRWLLLDPEARTEVLIDWEALWAPAIMPNLKQAVELRPDNPALVRLEQDVLADPVAGPLYRGCASVPVPHFDGSELPARHAVYGPGRLATCLAEPVTAPGARINVSFFVPAGALGFPSC
ncbi:helix-turn-helix transcriptional regulator [Streptomyces sp. NBC_00250]|uniref:MmyB family transcriptional regulator n=1 Tax=Streptomyces sp. NBC_00250 TaxID=2903641 RepID=UPI002E287B4B|nr:helix-turn-helix domain-containing protein [Streptomyces sp. NBC_00250]